MEDGGVQWRMALASRSSRLSQVRARVFYYRVGEQGQRDWVGRESRGCGILQLSRCSQEDLKEDCSGLQCSQAEGWGKACCPYW